MMRRRSQGQSLSSTGIKKGSVQHQAQSLAIVGSVLIRQLEINQLVNCNGRLQRRLG